MLLKTAEQVNNWIEQHLTLNLFPRVKVKAEETSNPDVIDVAALLETEDRHRCSIIVIKAIWPLVKPATVETTAKAIREAVKYVFMHEIDEAIKIDGVRVFDPHEDEKTRETWMSILNT